MGDVVKRRASREYPLGESRGVRRRELGSQMSIAFVPLEELRAASDFVSLNCALNQSTHHLINERMLRLMKPMACTARF